MFAVVNASAFMKVPPLRTIEKFLTTNPSGTLSLGEGGGRGLNFTTMNLKQHAFVNEYLYWNNPVIAYKNAYKSKSKPKTLESAANRLLKHPEVAEAIERAESSIRSRVENEVAQRLKVELLSIQEKRVILAQIARGEMYLEQTYKGKDCVQCKQYIKPSFNIMLRAIQEDSRLAGHYALIRADNHNKTQQNEHYSPLAPCPPQAQGVPPVEPGVDTRTEHPQNSQDTNKHNISQQNVAPPQTEDRGTTRAENPTTTDHNNSQQNTGNSPFEEGMGDARLNDIVGQVHSQTSENNNISQQPNVVSSTSQLKINNERVNSQQSPRLNASAVKTKPANTISHAGLRKLLSKKTGKSRYAEERIE